ncbi:unnamed protein product [Calypogeia fissa]
MEDNKVKDMVTTNRKHESNSWLMEEIGTRAALERLGANGVITKEVIHDDNQTIDTIIDSLGIANQKDLWHKAKNLVRKFIVELVTVTYSLNVDIDIAISRSELTGCTKKQLS